MYRKYVVNVEKEAGYRVSSPFDRTIKHIFAPDVRGVQELTFSQVTIPARGKTDAHTHDRGEIIFVTSGWGEVSMEDEVYELESDFAIWIPKGVKHALTNTRSEFLKIVTVFVPAYEAVEIRSIILKRTELTS